MFSWSIARRELVSLRREKTIVLALIIQLFIAGFSSFLLIGLVSMYDPGSAVNGQIDIGVTGEEQQAVYSTIESEGSWEAVVYTSEEAAQAAFDRRDVDAVLVATPRGNDGVSIEAIVPAQSIRSTVIVVQVREALKLIEQERREQLAARLTEQPVTIPALPPASPTFGFMYTVLLPLLVFLPVFISGSIAVDTLTEEIDAGTLELLRVTPLSMVDIIDGKLGAMIALVPVQVGAWLVLLKINGTPVNQPVLIVAFATVVAVIVVTVGAGVAVTLKNRQSAQLVYSFGLIIMFLAASLFPESPPNIIAKFAISSYTISTIVTVIGYGIAAVVFYGMGRRFIARATTT